VANVVDVKFYPNFNHMLNGAGGMVDNNMRRRALTVQAAARRQVGKRTGFLAKSIHSRRSRDTFGPYWYVGSTVSYAYMHHEGTRPHVIARSGGGKLRFATSGGIVFAPIVRHPGTKPNRYLKDSLYLALV
jgi:hypothetical protein